jgi:hypothetical protein
MLGLSTRKYEAAVREFREAYGLEKSPISEHFIEASQVKLKQMWAGEVACRAFVPNLISSGYKKGCTENMYLPYGPCAPAQSRRSGDVCC